MALAFQAVVLASDTGSRLYPLNSPATPKALLPIGNKAMLSFPFAMLEAGGVTEVLVVRTRPFNVSIIRRSTRTVDVRQVQGCLKDR